MIPVTHLLADYAKGIWPKKYPLCFMDFETVNWAIPRFPGMRPYDHVPFQCSIHVQREPGMEPEHYEFLAADASDPRREFISSLLATLGETGAKSAPVVHNAANQRFEMDVDGQLSVLEYTFKNHRLFLTHTEVPPALQNEGLGAKLAHAALEYARQNHLRPTIYGEPLV
jgi:predicted GNAT family acetyltransferase